jgi:serine/threonine protein kinase/tetratricopeptide (TPR) repeat protein
MKPNSDRIIELFSQAMAFSAPEERVRFLAEACRDQPELRAQVESLLQVEAAARGFLNPSATAETTATLIPEKPGDRIGRYTLREKLGEGGCGVVYMAEQTEPVRRQVALKVIKLGMDTQAVIARFEAERQALAMMDHPNIAKVFDAGICGQRSAVSDQRPEAGAAGAPTSDLCRLTSGSGRPYFVMELVRGIRITDYCEQHHLSTRDRLGLFIQVCHAIQHAHQKGIIHRDIKPSNVLVAQHDTVAVPKVIDFGIAKATTQQRLTDKTVFTAFEQFLGTPAYMSPEQAQLSGLDIDTRSDIYSLGVLLYELLTGRTPFDQKELLAAGLDEMRRIIREVEPVKPSTKLTQTTKTETRLLNSEKDTAPRTPHSAIPSDLDWIVMKTLEKDRARRYETANGLARDIERHLNNEPVVARPPSALYRFQKMVRRNKLAVSAAVIIGGVLVLGIAGSTWQAIRATRAEREQTRLRLAAQAEARTSWQVARLWKDTMEGVGPSVALGRDTELLREILDKAAQRTLDQLTNNPAVCADLLNTIAHVYHELGLFVRMEEISGQNLRLNRTKLGDTPATATALAQLGDALRHLGRFDQAEEHLRAAMAMRRQLFGEESLEMAASLNDLAELFKNRGEYKVAEKLYRQTLALRERLQGKDHVELAGALNNLAIALRRMGKYREAEELLRRSLTIRRKHLGKEHPDLVGTLGNLGSVLEDQGKLGEAEDAYRLDLEMAEKFFDPDHPEVAGAMMNLAGLLESQSKPDEAEPLAERALAIRQKRYGDESPQTLDALSVLALVRERQGRFEDAVVLHQKAIAVRRKVQGNNHPEVARSLGNLAIVLQRLGKLAEAEAINREVLDAFRRRWGDAHPDVVLAFDNLGLLLMEMSKLEEAETALKGAVDTGSKVLSPGHPVLAGCRHHLAQVLERRGKFGAVALIYRPAADAGDVTAANHLAWFLATCPEATSRDGSAAVRYAEMAVAATGGKDPANLDTLAAAYAETGQFTKAREVQQEAMSFLKEDAQKLDYASRLRLYESRFPYRDHNSLLWRARALLNEAKFAQAESAARECLALREREAADDWQVFDTRSVLGASLLGQKKYADAEYLLVSGYEGMKQHELKVPACKPRLKEAVQRLVRLYDETNRPDRATEWKARLRELEQADGNRPQ